jgi:hypothetical protein
VLFALPLPLVLFAPPLFRWSTAEERPAPARTRPERKTTQASQPALDAPTSQALRQDFSHTINGQGACRLIAMTHQSIGNAGSVHSRVCYKCALTKVSFRVCDREIKAVKLLLVFILNELIGIVTSFYPAIP